MKHHITLPTLQVAATAFLAATCHAQGNNLYCVDQKTSEVVAHENCKGGGDLDDLALIEGAPNGEIGSAIEGRDLAEEEEKHVGELKPIQAFGRKARAMKVAIGGFGRNGDTCDCHARDGYTGGIGAGGVFIGGGGARGGGSRGG